ncbi:AMP-binding protein [Methylobacter sp.]|uniref:AMP-binding protein n=1 Tax=Methylobacter sp. TaxID=2051955 RepID=UPI003DA3A746
MSDTKKIVKGIVASNSKWFIYEIFNCISSGCIAVTLRSESDEHRIKSVSIDEIVVPKIEYGWMTIDFSPSDSDDVAQILFTSGTEGEPKGIEITHQGLSDVVTRLNSIMEVDSSIREYIGIPVYHSFGFGRCRAVATAGGSFYIPVRGFDPIEVSTMLRNGEINAVSAVPSLWRVLLQNKEIFGDEAGNLKWIEIGSQYMCREEKEALKSLFYNARIVQHYGLTEASRSTFLEIHKESGSALESVGKPVGQTEIRLSDDNRIMIRGPHVAKMSVVHGIKASLTDGDGWLTTNDLGSFENGFLFFNGRADDVINCGGVKLQPEVVESEIFNTLGVKTGIAICRIPDQLRGDGILIVTTPEIKVSKELVFSASTAVLSLHGIHIADSVKLIQVDNIPKTDTGKIQRRLLANIYLFGNGYEVFQNNQSKSMQQYVAPKTDQQKELVKIWEELLGTSPIGIDDSFFDLGGDSLSAINIMIKMQKYGIDEASCRGIFKGLTIREITDGINKSLKYEEKPVSVRAKTNLMINNLRFFLVLFVVLSHWSGFVFDRLPADLKYIENLLFPIFAFGTPGFAIIFGISIGFIIYPHFRESPKSLNNMIKTGLTLIGSGILMLALMNICLLIGRGEVLDWTKIFNAFWSVLVFYFLCLPTLHIWLRVISWKDNEIFNCLILACFSFLISIYFGKQFSGYQLYGLYEFIKLIFTAKYNYFSMLTGVFLGFAMGIYIYRSFECKKLAKNMLITGTVISMLGVLLSVILGDQDQWWIRGKPVVFVWMWIFYYGVIMLIVSGLRILTLNYERRSEFIKKSINIGAVIGQLALPIYVMHEIAMPMKNLLDIWGFNIIFSLMISLGLFFTIIYLSGRKLYSIYYAS